MVGISITHHDRLDAVHLTDACAPWIAGINPFQLIVVLRRYEYSKLRYAPNDPHYGLIWGSPEEDLDDPLNGYPNSSPFYYQNAAGV